VPKDERLSLLLLPKCFGLMMLEIISMQGHLSLSARLQMANAIIAHGSSRLITSVEMLRFALLQAHVREDQK
jgi:hypothetical protein